MRSNTSMLELLDLDIFHMPPCFFGRRRRKKGKGEGDGVLKILMENTRVAHRCSPQFRAPCKKSKKLNMMFRSGTMSTYIEPLELYDRDDECARCCHPLFFKKDYRVLANTAYIRRFVIAPRGCRTHCVNHWFRSTSERKVNNSHSNIPLTR